MNIFIAPLLGLFCCLTQIISLAKQFTLGKMERLKSRKKIELVFKEGRKLSSPPFRVSWIISKEPGQPPLQFGAGVSNRNFKKAVDRNRIKRLTREAWRLQKHDLFDLLDSKQASMSVFLIYTGKEIPLYEQVYNSTGIILNKLKGLAGG